MTRIPGILIAFLAATTALAESADLSLVGSSPAAFELLFAVVNHGPDVAKNAVVTMDVPAGLEIKTATVGSHACDTSQRPVRCALGDLHAGLPANYSALELVAPIADATYTATVTVTSDTPDPNVDNQTLSGTWTTKVEADLIVDVRATADRADPGDLLRFPWYLCNLVANNAWPRDVRIDFTATGGVFETLKTPDGFTCTIDGASAACTAAEFNGQCPYNLDLTVRTSGDRSGNEAKVTARISSNVPERDSANNEAVAKVAMYRWITVDSTADDGPGSLRQAIGQANDHCSPGPCRIVFEIPAPVPPEGWFTITPLTPLPGVTADRVTLEGARQTAFTGNTNASGPEIAIDGRLAGHGLKMRTNCEGLVNGLAIGNFREDEGLWISTGGSGTPPCPSWRSDRVAVEDNFIGVDPSGSTPWPNRRGLRADGMRGLISRNTIRFNDFAGLWMWQGSAYIQHNTIAGNGAAGILLGPQTTASIWGNTISANAQMGVALARGIGSVDIRDNAMKDNGGLGIDWELDGPSPVDRDDRSGFTNAPVMLHGYYAAATNTTTVAVTAKSLPFGSTGALSFYANAAADGDGERPIDRVWTKSGDGVVIASFHGDYRGKWINATWTRTASFDFGPWMTSELSNAIPIE